VEPSRYVWALGRRARPGRKKEIHVLWSVEVVSGMFLGAKRKEKKKDMVAATG